MRTALLALALSPTLAVVPCSSDKPDDVDTEGCYGWCSAAFAADHVEPAVEPVELQEAVDDRGSLNKTARDSIAVLSLLRLLTSYVTA